MAKKFIARIEQPMSEEVLADLFTSRRRGINSSENSPVDKTQSTSSNRKKSFMKAMNRSRDNKSSSSEYAPTSERRFLDAMEDVLNDEAFESIFPTKRQGKVNPETPISTDVPFSLMISENIFNRAKEIAQEKGVRIKDVINLALERYIDQVKT